MRNTKIGAVLGRNQSKRLDEKYAKRKRNFWITLLLNNSEQILTWKEVATMLLMY